MLSRFVDSHLYATIFLIQKNNTLCVVVFENGEFVIILFTQNRGYSDIKNCSSYKIN